MRRLPLKLRSGIHETQALLALFLFPILATTAGIPPNPVWSRPTIIPAPAATPGVRQPVMSLNGTWKINPDPPTEFWSTSIDPSSWRDVNIPRQAVYGATQSLSGLTAMQPGKPYAYRTRFVVPANFAGRRILLKFEGVGGQAKVWVNGNHIRDHAGTTTTWDCDITSHVAAGKEASLTVGITESLSGHGTEGLESRGGLVRGVKLIALPQDYITRFNVETDLDRSYKDATLKIWIAAAFHKGNSALVRFVLKDKDGKPVALNPDNVELTRDRPETILEVPVMAPVKWDAEHPNLYTLDASLSSEGQVTEAVSRNIGFRKIELSGRKLLVNGKEVKLRGVNGGRPEIESGANLNHIRARLPSEEFLDACDRVGMYVQDETSPSFAVNGVQNDPAYTAVYMDTIAELVERDISHPSILMWSLGNESAWGRNVKKMADYTRLEDPSRPIMFSYSETAPRDNSHPLDIYAFHYVFFESDLSDLSNMVWTEVDGDPAIEKFSPALRKQFLSNLPIIHDEFNHIQCYNPDEQRRDPGLRTFWGLSSKGLWENIFTREGALGGDLFGSVDSACAWGLIDAWGREKPEYWLTKKGYSPIRIQEKPLANPELDRPLDIPIKNWFDHTNLNELGIVWTVGKESGAVTPPDVAPHSSGILRLAPRNWKDGEVVNLKFYRLGKLLVDEYNLAINPASWKVPQPQGPAPGLREEQDRILVSGTDFSLEFSRKTGLITKGTYKGTDVIKSGPSLRLGGLELPEWSLKSVSARREAAEAVVDMAGRYGAAEVSFQVRVDGQGLITTNYRLDSMPLTPPLPLRRGWKVGGYEDVGVSFVLTSAIDRLAWRRNGQWSAYPEDHIGRNSGVALRESKAEPERYDVRPTRPWAEEERSFNLFGQYDIGGRGTNDFRSMKQDILYAAAFVAGTEKRLQAESDGNGAVRLIVLDDPRVMVDDRDPRLKLEGHWTAFDDMPRSYKGTETYSNHPGDYAELTFNGQGICWMGSRDVFFGPADVYVDGKLESTGVLPYARGGNEPRAIRFSKESLPDGPHTIRVVVPAKNGSESNTSGFVPIDAFKILDGKSKGDVQFIISNEWNYPEAGWRIWGDYVKDAIAVGTGYSNTVRMRFRDGDDPR